MLIDILKEFDDNPSCKEILTYIEQGLLLNDDEAVAWLITNLIEQQNIYRELYEQYRSLYERIERNSHATATIP